MKLHTKASMQAYFWFSFD